MNLSLRFLFLLIAILALPFLSSSQEGFSIFTTDFPPEEFAQRRAAVYAAIGEGNVALIQGAAMPSGYTRFRQSNEFYYLCGIETPHAYLLLNGTTKRATVYLPNRHVARERSEGKLLSAEDDELVRNLSGIDAVSSTDMLAEHLARMAWTSSVKTIYTPFQPAEGFAMSRDLAVRVIADYAADPFDGRGSREGHFINLLRSRFPQFEIKDVSPILDELRLIKSPREITLIRKATRLSGLALIEGMRSTKPGIYEYELDAMAKYVYYRNGAQGEAYYSLIASGPNAMFGHYNAGKRQMKEGDFLLFDFAPDVGYYMADVTRMIPVGKFTDWQRELYGFYLSCYRAIIKSIRPNVTAQVVRQAAAKEMEQILAKSKFSKPIYEKAATQFVESYKQGTNNPYATLGHWVGMATHDVGSYRGPLKPGMVFTIEPALRVPEERINIRLEDMILITEKGAENMSDFVPMEIDAIEKIMKEEGMVQKYPSADVRR